MQWVRKGVVHILAVLLFCALIGVGFGVAFATTLGSAATVKGWFASSGLYRNVATQTVKDASGGNVIFASSEVIRLANTIFTPELINKTADTIIDSNYRWLSGASKQPDFSIDLSSERKAFATRAGETVSKRLASLPACSLQELAKIQIPFDPMQLACRPANLNASGEGTRITREISDSDFLSQPVITASTLTEEGKQPYYRSADWLPSVYKIARALPLIAGIAALVLAIGIIFIAPTKRKGLRRIGFMALFAGLILAASGLAAKAALQETQAKIGALSFTGSSKAVSDSIYNAAGESIQASLLTTGAVCIVLAAIIFTGLFLLRKNSGRQAPVSDKSFEREKALANIKNDTGAAVLRPISGPTVNRRTTPGMDVTQAPKPVAPRPLQPNATAPAIKKQSRPRKPRLIQ